MKPTLTLLAILSLGQTLPAIGEPLEVSFRYGRFHSTYRVNLDGTAVETHDWALTVLKEDAIEWSKTASIGHSTSAQKAEVIAAYTRKADGRRLDVPKDNYQLNVNSGKGADSPVYSDWTTLTVVFPDVAVGDTVALSYRVTLTQPMFPNRYSELRSFGRQLAMDDVRVQIDYPSAMWAQYQAVGMKETTSQGQGDRKIVEWTYANPTPSKTVRRDYSVFDPDKEVGFAFSTFRNHQEIATAYGERAIPKAAVSKRIEDLAAQIVKGRADKKDQARTLYEWVARNLTYAGNCIGIGAVVPRDLTFTLDNKMGDCKDHATLLQALLGARGIKSTQALLNAGSLYRLPRIPAVANVNHVINYLPEWDLYLDSTSDATPFGTLPFEDQDKPVLLVEGYRDGLKTPVPAVGGDQQTARVAIKIAPDGSVTGSVDVAQKGRGAVQTRAWLRRVTKDGEDDMIKGMLRQQGLVGSGKLEKDDPTELIDTYHYKASLSAEKFVKMPGAGAFYIYPPIGIVPAIASFLGSSTEVEQEADVTCTGINAIEEYVIELPETVKVLSIPDNMTIGNELLSYSATYKLEGSTLRVQRTLNDRTKGNVCTPAMMADVKKIAQPAMDNLKEQVLYK